MHIFGLGGRNDDDEIFTPITSLSMLESVFVECGNKESTLIGAASIHMVFSFRNTNRKCRPLRQHCHIHRHRMTGDLNVHTDRQWLAHLHHPNRPFRRIFPNRHSRSGHHCSHSVGDMARNDL